MGGKGSGRRTRVEQLRDTAQILHEAAPGAARYLAGVVRGEIKRPSWSRIEVCIYILDHELGKPRIKAELTGAGGTPLTLQALMILALEGDGDGSKPPKITGTEGPNSLGEEREDKDTSEGG